MKTSRKSLAAAALIAALLSAALIWLGLRRYAALELIWPLDAGVLTQVACNSAAGDWFHMTLRMDAPYNCLHRSPIALLFAPALWLWPDARAILVVEDLLLGLSALLVFGIARRRGCGGNAALLLCAGYALSLPLWAVGLDDIWYDKLAIPALLLALWALEAERTALLLAALAALLAVQEGFFVAAGIVALACLLRRDRGWVVRLGPLLIVAAYIVVVDLIWSAPGQGPGALRAVAARVGGGPAEAELHWQGYLPKLLRFGEGFGPPVLLVWGAAAWIWMLAPGVGKLLLIGPLLYDHKSIYYASDVLALAFYLSACALPRWIDWIERWAARHNGMKPPWRLLAALLLAWWAVPTLLFVVPERLFKPDAQDRAIAALARSIPRERAVHVDPDFAPLVACRPRATLETEPEQRPLARCADDLLLWSERRPGHMDADLTWLRAAALTLSPRFAVAGRAGGAVHLINITGRSWTELSAARCLTPTQEDQDVR